MAKGKRIALAADHGGYALKERLAAYLVKKGYRVSDFGTSSAESCDYPGFGYGAAKAVAKKKADLGIVVCKTGFGMAIVANKVRGVRSAVCDTPAQAASAREHNGCNVLSLAATRVKYDSAKRIAETFINTAGAEGRHGRRVRQIIRLEKKR